MNKKTDQLSVKVTDAYLDIFESNPKFVIFAPGRINLIGEHTDYSEGFVFPMAINQGIVMGFSPRPDDHIKLYSLDFNQMFDQDIHSFSRGEGDWEDYIKGIAWALGDLSEDMKGFEGVFAGNLPIGAGLSSSAALEMAALRSFCISNSIDLPEIEMAKLGFIAERDWIGVNCGIMDQLISTKGKAGYALKLDCRTLEFEYVPIPDDINFIVLDTMTRRTLRHSAYNTRHEEVKKASQILGVSYLRDATEELLEMYINKLEPVLFQRAKHVISENKRVDQFDQAMKNNDLESMGRLINASHKSLRDDFEVSSDELNVIVEIAQAQDFCLGARMTGAGFGGCALAMTMEKAKDSFISSVDHKYKSITGIKPNIFKVQSSDGVHTVTCQR